MKIQLAAFGSLAIAISLSVGHDAKADEPRPAATPPATASSGQSDAAVAAALKRSEQSTGVALHGQGATSTTTGVVATSGGAPVGAKTEDLGAIRGSTTSTGDATAGNARAVATPDTMKTATTDAPKSRRHVAITADMSAVPDAEKVVASFASKFAVCTKQNQATQPGRVMVEVKVTPAGAVEATSVLARGEFQQPVAMCVATVLRDAKFSAPAGGAATLKVPVYLNRR